MFIFIKPQAPYFNYSGNCILIPGTLKRGVDFKIGVLSKGISGVFRITDELRKVHSNCGI